MNIYITLDYELFLGEQTGTPANCLIRPMNELCKVADKHNFRYTIFVDAAYLLRMYQLKDKFVQLAKDYEMVSEHISMLSYHGHDIQLHFHPQWLFSNFIEGYGWDLQRLPYKLSDMKEEEVFSLFHEAKKLLDGIVDYRTISFRAGGYCLTSFTEYKKLFQEEGILIDSSVARGLYTTTPVHSYDYRHIPKKQIYHFDTDVCIESSNGPFTELSISTVSWSGVRYMTMVRPRMASYNPLVKYADGKSIVDNKSRRQNSIVSKVSKFFKPYRDLASIDGIRSCQLDYIFDEVENSGQKDIVLIGHPKLVSDASVKNLDTFIAKCKNDIFRTTKDLLI